MNYEDFDHEGYAKTKKRDDFWGQVRRTVNGENVDDSQIEMIVESIKNNLTIKSSDTIIDIGCGNGALTYRIINFCKKIYGIDISNYLISIAKENFERNNLLQFEVSNIIEFLKTFSYPNEINKILCYGAFSYLENKEANRMLKLINEYYKNVESIFLGNLPDEDKHNVFFKNYKPSNLNLKDHTTSIGIWRSKDQLKKLAFVNGWKAIISEMPKEFYGSSFRYDALLVRKN